MDAPIKRNKPHTPPAQKDVLEISYEFTKQLHKELGDLIKAVVLFGSATNKKNPNDIDILVIIDDIEIQLTEEIQTAYRVIVENVIRATSNRLHITTLRFSNFWEYVRTSDPVIVTVLREGTPLIDTGFFTPTQLLLQQGRIRPSRESIWAYYSRSPQLLTASKYKLLLAIIDLYWAVIDAAHASLMAAGVTPETPEHVPGLLKEHFVAKGLLEHKHAETANKLYELQKDIYQRRLESISAERYEELYAQAKEFVETTRTLIE